MILYVIDTILSIIAGGAGMYFAVKAGIVDKATKAEEAVVTSVKSS